MGLCVCPFRQNFAGWLTRKDPDEWLSGDDPMTGAQASYLKTLCEQAGMPELFNENLTKAEASKLIDEMRQQAGVE